jgi:hypothetical protein
MELKLKKIFTLCKLSIAKFRDYIPISINQI